MEASRSSSSVVIVAGCMLAATMMCSVGVEVVGAQSSLATKCAQEFQKVTACLSFATGKADQPTKECCSAVTGIRETDPACLCFFIQQTHNGSEQIKSLGIQASRLLRLPSECSLKNSSISDCPRLLGIPPTSPDYAIFTNTSAAAPAAPTGTSSPTTSNNDSGVAEHSPQLPAYLMIAAIMVFLGAFPIGSASKFLGSW